MSTDREVAVADYLTRHRDEMIQELRWAQAAIPASKDILVVFHNQADFLRRCLDSVSAHTSNYRLYLWDNGSDDATKAVARSVPGATLIEHESNLGFVEPNNRLAAMGEGEYLILLNSDTLVFDLWSEALVGYLQANSTAAEVGYLGGRLDAQGLGGRACWGGDIDYVMGWCACISRETYRQHGLFDPEFRFAYAEDADLSLRLRAAGGDLYALHLLLVHHYENRTIKAVHEAKAVDLRSSFDYNHDLLRRRWADYLANERMDLRQGAGP